MAIIQDLPSESLHRILELGAEDPECFTARDLSSTALVARAWAQPSLEVLVYERWSPHLTAHPKFDSLPPSTRRIRFMIVKSPTTAAMARHLVEPHRTQLTHLDVSGVCPTSDLVLLLVNGTFSRSPSILIADKVDVGVEHLALNRRVEGDFTFLERIHLTLQWLSLDSSATLPASFLQELIAHAPHLTRLELDNDPAFLAAYRTPLLALAPQLRHLSLRFPLSQLGDSDPCVLLRTCTSLVSLDLEWLRPGSLPTVLSSIPSHLAILACSFNEDDSTDESVSSALHDALKQPTLSKLKRWRWKSRFRSTPSRGWIPYWGSTVESWEAACRARGIEPRGSECYFTGELSAGFSRITSDTDPLFSNAD